ncbi:hypothetical protein DFJ43DRAFT_1072761 [Lentinula guzmanii]|uniref:Uncharacterized protein n=1 Tax=Lentinula guzmanii TaxID=2804957 RepID=A0AA38N1D8_9AGAR|nr:hypothetical protein DFJ43DRAFT_1072761 [Lentinula guzmanii]
MVGSLNPSENVVETFHFVSIVVETIFAVIAQNFGRSIRVLPMLLNPIFPKRPSIRISIETFQTREVFTFMFFRFPASDFVLYIDFHYYVHVSLLPISNRAISDFRMHSFRFLIKVFVFKLQTFTFHVLHLVHHLSITFPNPSIIRVTFISHTCHPYVAH